MLSNFKTTRRLLLRRIAIGSACLAAMAKPGLGKASPRFDGRPELRFAVDLVRKTMPHQYSAARLGAAYLRNAPEEYDLACLQGVLKRRVPEIEGVLEYEEPEIVKSTIRRQITADFERGDVVEVDGWIMSLTEVRLAALAYLVQGLAPTA